MSRDAVDRNREALEARARACALGFARQVHGAEVRRADAGRRRPRPDAEPGRLPRADGQATAMPGVAPMVLTADCLPVAVAGEGAVAMLHAGWRGLAAGVIAAGVAALRELGADGR